MANIHLQTCQVNVTLSSYFFIAGFSKKRVKPLKCLEYVEKNIRITGKRETLNVDASRIIKCFNCIVH